MSTALTELSSRLKLNAQEVQNIVMNTVMPNGGRNVSNEQFTTFISVANEYGLNPLTKEVYAFPTKGGGIQPIVSIDGWLKIINNHPDFDGMEFVDNRDSNANLASITCRIFRKGRSHPTEMTEYLSECNRGTEPWQKWPSRMLRHKATIQCARYAFGLSGIIDEDEAERFEEAGVVEKDVTPTPKSKLITDAQIEIIEDLVSQTGSNRTQMIKVMSGDTVTELNQLTEQQADNAIKLLHSKVAKQQNQTAATTKVAGQTFQGSTPSNETEIEI